MTDKKQVHYFAPRPHAGHDFKRVAGEWEGISFSFLTDRDVFSRDRVDPGTGLLLENVLKAEKDRPVRLLDLGTGIGIMALVLAQLRPAFSVTGSDVNSRALDLARQNARFLDLEKRTSFMEADGVPAGGVYDLIVCNPPIRTGKDTVYRLFREAEKALAPDGALYIVIRVKQGARSAREELLGLFDRVDILDRSGGYHVIKAWKVKEESL